MVLPLVWRLLRATKYFCVVLFSFASTYYGKDKLKDSSRKGETLFITLAWRLLRALKHVVLISRMRSPRRRGSPRRLRPTSSRSSRSPSRTSWPQFSSTNTETYSWCRWERKLKLLLPIFSKMGHSRPLFRLLSFFSHDKYSTNTLNDKSVDGVLGIRTHGRIMVGADDTSELWRPPSPSYLYVFVALRQCQVWLKSIIALFCTSVWPWYISYI